MFRRTSFCLLVSICSTCERTRQSCAQITVQYATDVESILAPFHLRPHTPNDMWDVREFVNLKIKSSHGLCLPFASSIADCFFHIYLFLNNNKKCTLHGGLGSIEKKNSLSTVCVTNKSCRKNTSSHSGSR